MAAGKPIASVSKNTREQYQIDIREYQGHKFVDIRLYALEDGKDPIPTKKGVTVAPSLWRDFKAALALVEAELIKRKLVDPAGG